MTSFDLHSVDTPRATHLNFIHDL